MTSGGKHKLTLPWGGKSKIENDLMGVENARGAEFVKMPSPLQTDSDPIQAHPEIRASQLQEQVELRISLQVGFTA